MFHLDKSVKTMALHTVKDNIMSGIEPMSQNFMKLFSMSYFNDCFYFSIHGKLIALKIKMYPLHSKTVSAKAINTVCYATLLHVMTKKHYTVLQKRIFHHNFKLEHIVIKKHS